MNYTKNNLMELAMAYINYKAGNVNVAQNRLSSSLQVL
jgi:hypothetical protein